MSAWKKYSKALKTWQSDSKEKAAKKRNDTLNYLQMPSSLSFCFIQGIVLIYFLKHSQTSYLLLREFNELLLRKNKICIMAFLYSVWLADDFVLETFDILI